MNKRLAAFTIMELTVSMLLSALVISITYTALQIVTRSYQAFSQKNEQLAALVRLDELLRRDFSLAAAIYKTGEGVELHGAPVSGTIRYAFSPGFILRRTELVTDTFRVEAANVQISFEGEPVEQDTDEVTEQGGRPPEASRIDALGFALSFQNEKYPYHYSKTYSSENLLNRKAHAYH